MAASDKRAQDGNAGTLALDADAAAKQGRRPRLSATKSENKRKVDPRPIPKIPSKADVGSMDVGGEVLKIAFSLAFPPLSSINCLSAPQAIVYRPGKVIHVTDDSDPFSPDPKP